MIDPLLIIHVFASSLSMTGAVLFTLNASGSMAFNFSNRPKTNERIER
jgi:hypothetical protein